MLLQELGIEASLTVGSSGIFEVKVDGRVVAAKARGTFPGEAEIVAAVAAARSPSPA